MTDQHQILDRAGLPLLLVVVAIVGIVLGYAAFRSAPTPVMPSPSPTPAAGTGWIGTAPTTRPAPTIRQRVPAPTRAWPTRPPVTATEPRTRASGTPSHTPTPTATRGPATTKAPEPTTAPPRSPEPSPTPEPAPSHEPDLTATVEATP